MTSQDNNTSELYRLLADIFEVVKSIDDNVESILDRLDSHLEDMRYEQAWREQAYTYEAEHDD